MPCDRAFWLSLERVHQHAVLIVGNDQTIGGGHCRRNLKGVLAAVDPHFGAQLSAIEIEHLDKQNSILVLETRNCRSRVGIFFAIACAESLLACQYSTRLLVREFT